MAQRQRVAATELAAAKALHTQAVREAAADIGLNPAELRNRRAIMLTVVAWVTEEIHRMEMLLPPTDRTPSPLPSGPEPVSGVLSSPCPPIPSPLPNESIPSPTPVNVPTASGVGFFLPPTNTLQAVPVHPDDIEILTVEAGDNHVDLITSATN